MNFFSHASSKTLQMTHRGDTMLARETNMAHIPLQALMQVVHTLRGWLQLK